MSEIPDSLIFLPSEEMVMMTAIKNSVGTEVFRSRWGFHPCSHDDFLRFKELHKQVYREMRISRVRAAWERKTVNRSSVEPPRSEVQTRLRLSDREFLVLYQELLRVYRDLRTPGTDPDEVIRIARTVDEWEHEMGVD